MSRIRTIKPEFWVSEQVVSCSPNARLLFIGLWNFSDDHGVHPVSYVRLKAEVFPVDSFTIDDVKRWIDELIANDLLREYVVDNKAYWIITGWGKHQRIDKPTYRHPLPLSELRKIPYNSSNNHRELDEYSETTQRIVDEPSLTDRNGKERKGKEKDIREVETSPACVSDPKSLASTQEVFSHWQHVMNHPRAKLDGKRKSKILQALKLGYGVDGLKQAIDGCSKTPYNMGKSESGQKFDDISLILRDAEHIERFINNAINTPNEVMTSRSLINVMAGVI
ncbi:MAG: hypothetical protein WAW86_10120 [Gammaproteobacteria bacterium]